MDRVRFSRSWEGRSWADSEDPASARVMLEGVATPSDEVAEMLPSSRDSGGRFAGGDRGELLVRITPTGLGAAQHQWLSLAAALSQP